MTYLADVIVPFDGTIFVNLTTPPVQANYTTIRNWAERILEEVRENNRTAYQNYGNISSLYDKVGSSLCAFKIVQYAYCCVGVRLLVVMMMVW